jgi:hypothetical protein
VDTWRHTVEVASGLPRLASETTRYFPDNLPIGWLQMTPTYTFLNVVTRPVPVDFRGFLERQAELLGALRTCTIRLVVPRHLTRGGGV